MGDRYVTSMLHRKKLVFILCLINVTFNTLPTLY